MFPGGLGLRQHSAECGVLAENDVPTPSIPASETILAYLDKHCRVNPLDRLVTGAGSLVKEVGGTRK